MATERIDVIVTETGTREVSRRIEDVGRAAARASGPLLAMQRLLASYISFEGIRRLMQLADQYTEMENRIRVLDGTTQHYSVTLRRLYNISQETRSSLRDNVLLFQRMGLAQRELGATTEQLFQVTQAVGQAIAIQGGLATTSAGAVLQLSQAFGSGRVQLEEFNSVITGLYPIAKAAAEGIDATGGSIARLRRMIADGEVDSRMLFQGILNSLDSLDEQFKQTTPTVSQAFTILRNSLVMYVGDLNSASGASESFAKAIITLSKNMDEVVKGAVVLGAALGPAALTRVVLGLRAAFIALNATMLANPIGAMATAISALIAYYLVFNKKLEETAKRIDENSTVVDRMGATWAGVLAYIKKAWENFPEWFGDLIYRALDEAIKALANFGTTMAQGLMPDIKAAAKIMQFFGRENVSVDEEGIRKWFEDKFNFELPPGVRDRMSQHGSDAAQAFTDAYEDYLLRARHRREQHGLGGDGGGDGLPPGAPNEKALKDLQKELNRVLDAIDPVEAAWRKFFESVDTLDKGLAAGLLTLEDYEVALTKLKATMLDDVFPFEAIMRGLLTQRVLLSKEVSERERLAQIYEVEKTLKRALTKEELQLLDARLQMLQVAEREAQLMDEIQQPTLDYSRNIQALNNLYRDGVISASEFNQKLQELRYQFLQTQTDFGSGVERGLLAIERDFTDTASLIEQAMVRAFGNMEDALTDFFRTGKLSVKRFVDDVLNDLARLYVRQNITAPLAQSLGLMGDYSQKAEGNINLNFGAGSANSLGNAISWVGDKMGSEALSSFAAGMKGSTLAPGLHGPTTQGASGAMGLGAKVGSNFGSILGYGQAIYSLTQGQYGSAAGAAIGTYILPGIGTAVGSFLGGMVDSVFGDREPTTRRGQRARVDFTGGEYGVTSTDDRQPGAEAAIRQMAQQAVESANALMRQTGVDAAIDAFYAITESSIKGDRQGVGSGGQLRIGDRLIDFGLREASDMTLGGFGGWSSVDPMQRIGTEIQLSMLEALKAVSDELPSALSSMLEVDIRGLDEAGAADLVARFTALTEGATAFLAAIEQMPFEHLRDVTLDAAVNMVQFAGGVENLLSAQQTYYERFHSDAERHAHAVDQLTQVLAGVGVEMPALVGSTDDMLARYRALVDSLDLNTEAGQQAYVTLMQTAGAFADVAQFAGQAAAELERAAEEQRRAADRARQGALRGLEQAYNAVVQAGQREIAKLQQAFSETDSAMSAYRTAVQRLESDLGNLLAAIGRSVADLRGQVMGASQMQYEQARAVISTALLTGQLPQTADLSEAIRIAQQGVTGARYGSLLDQQRAYATLANEIESLRGIVEPELDTARATLAQLEEQYALLRGTQRIESDSLTVQEQQLRQAFSVEEAARQQISVVEQQLEATRQHYEALTGIKSSIDGGVMTLSQALAQYAQAAAGVGSADSMPSGGTGTFGRYGSYVEYITGNPDLLSAYLSQGSPEPRAWARWHWDTYGQYENRPIGLRAYASGGYYPGGLALVGEYGPELINFRQPGQIYTANQTNDILWQLGNMRGDSDREGHREVVAAIQRLEERLDQIEAADRATAVSTRRLADMIDAVTRGAPNVHVTIVGQDKPLDVQEVTTA